MAERTKYDPCMAEVLPWANAIARSEGSPMIQTRHLLLGALKCDRGSELLSELLFSDLPLHPELVEPALAGPMHRVEAPVADKAYTFSPRLQAIADTAWGARGLLGGVLSAAAIFRVLVQAMENEEDFGSRFWANARKHPLTAPKHASTRLRLALERLEALRATLASRVVGQERAIDQVADAYFEAFLHQLRAESDHAVQRGPRCLFTFVGPPGVGKTYLAELLAEHLSREPAAAEGAGDGPAVAGAPPFLRLDMSGYAGYQAHESLIGADRAYRGADKGVLTGFIEQNPEGFVLVDEIEKAHPNTQHLFLQILDGGHLWDHHTRTQLDFSKATVVFTTNLGSELYDAPNRSGVLQESRELGGVLLDALQAGADSRTFGQSGFSPELVSRIAKGFVVLFQRLDGLALEQLAELTVTEVSNELRRATGLHVEIADPTVVSLLVLRFAAGGDARRLKAGVRQFLLGAIEDVLSDHRGPLLDDTPPLADRLQGMRLTLASPATLPEQIDERLGGKSRILLVDDDPWEELFDEPFACHRVQDREGAENYLRGEEADLILLDLHIGAPATSGDCDQGWEILRWLRTRYPHIPVYLFSESPERRGVSAELLERISLEGGARGVLQKGFVRDGGHDPTARDAFFRKFREIDAAWRRQRMVDHFRRRAKSIDFDLHVDLDRGLDDGWLSLEVCRVREVTTVAARDRRGRGWVDIPRERFTDIAGAGHAKQRLQEVAQWLEDPGPLREMGLDLPKGILLKGPPGTGKTTLARAVAGEAEVPFFAVSASELIQGNLADSTAEIRDLFSRARRYAPAVIFIDEIDAIGRHRSDSNAWWGSLLNELLTQLDGFDTHERPVFVLAATNRADVLDRALVRSGRFDLQVEVPSPNAAAREAILKIYLKPIPCASDLDIPRLAGRTAGFSGADLRQVCKEAGLLALRQGDTAVSQAHLQDAVTNIRHGLASERTTLSEESSWSTAVHEAGHAVVQHLLLPDESVSQVTILPRGHFLGVTELSDSDTYVDVDLPRLRNRVRCGLAGRAAEALLLGPDRISAGCSNDLWHASRITLLIISRYGLDAELGLLSLPGAKVGLGLSSGSPVDMAFQEEAMARARAWLAEQEEATRHLLEEHRACLQGLSEKLRDQETIYGDELSAYFAETLTDGRESDTSPAAADQPSRDP